MSFEYMVYYTETVIRFHFNLNLFVPDTKKEDRLS